MGLSPPPREAAVKARKVRDFRPEELVKLGTAPWCSACQGWMLPLNLSHDRALCQCPTCGTQARLVWTN